jgi:hypothetical protein
MSRSGSLPAAQAITIKLLPVNSSAPPSTTRIKPSPNTMPAKSRLTPNGMTPSAPAMTVVANIAPSAMKAPASTASAIRLSTSSRAL